jgi:hypothetical protein
MTYATTWPLLSTPSPSAPGHVDPSTIPLEQLARIRGAMWTATLGGLPYGPRPFQDDNILALEFLYLYDADDQRRMLQAWQARGYTHVPFGPCNGQGYHGMYPDVSFTDNFDAYLDVLQLLWDHGIAPIFFVKGDYWTTADLVAHEHLFKSERAQRLIRIVVPGGWEPARETPSTVWREWLEWGARVFPKALRLLHMVADHDAPGSSSEGIPNDQLWNNVVHLLHGWLVQSFAFADPTQVNEEQGITAYQEWLNSYDVRVSGSYPDRFRNGYAGWPTHSAWGAYRPLIDYPGEYGSYWVYHDNRPEAEAQAWGDAAIGVGAKGYLDGGTVKVP